MRRKQSFLPMGYEHYSVEEFLLDEYLHRWVSGPDAQSERFWQDFLRLHPHQRAVVERARRRLLAIKQALEGPWLISPSETTQMWREVKSRLR